jgi:Domain of unknown function (DUF4386)
MKVEEIFIHKSKMAIYAVDKSQRKAARVAGFMCLFTMVTANFAEFYVRGRLIVPGDAVQTAKNIAASGQLFRLGIVTDLATLVGGVILVVALYVVLKPVNRDLALLAVFWRLLECSIAAVMVGIDFAVLRLLNGASSLRAFNTEQLQELARLLLGVETGGYRVGALFFGLGSTLFAYLWFKSRYIPRLLAAWGILASLVPTIVPLSTIAFAGLTEAPLRRARTGIPIVVFEVILGVWLLAKGIQAPLSIDGRDSPAR